MISLEEIETREVVEFTVIGVVVFFVLWLSIFNGVEFFEVSWDTIIITAEGISEDSFVAFALAVNFAYELIPQSVQIISVGAIGVRLLQGGFNPWIFAFFIGLGKLVGQLLLYLVGVLIANAHQREFKIMEMVEHYFHKYHYFVFFLPPWLGFAGDGIMLTAGHQKISLIRIIPILLATNYVEALRWVLPAVGQLEISDVIDQ